MEVDWFENVATAEEMLPVDADNDASMFEGERCGICMDIIIDRGVLDCCQDWFCFPCIDNWSTITNLCPLCQNEFQLITCVPVYDTIGGNNSDEDLVSRDDEWSVEGKNNTLSFPSYYIDENAVTCLDGDGCKLRIGSVTLDENLTFDTSIACDSCDTWYHAFCVGFDTESTSVESWLCPRCLVDEAHTLDANATELGQNKCHSGSAENQCSAEIFSGKVSISVADDGETAVVVSMVDQKHLVEEPTEKSLTTECLGIGKTDNIDLSRSTTPESSSDNPLVPSSQIITNDLPSSEAGDIRLPVLTDMALGSTFSNNKSKSKFEDKVMFDDAKVSSIKYQSIKKEILEDDATLRPDEGSAVARSVGENVKSIQIDADERKCCSLPIDSCHRSADESNSQADVLAAVGEKRRRKGCSASACPSDRKRARLASEGSSKETKAEKSAEGTSVVGRPDRDAFYRSQEVGHDRISSRDECEQLESEEVDIMSIVKGTTESKILCRKPTNKFSQRRDVVGPRVKKIVRRPVEDKESMVQNLRKEIREAIHEKSSEDVGRSIFDPKLLAAFRAAVSVPDAEPVKKISASVAKAKNLMLQKGRTRENLTKKIYATASGKRRHAWYRDCQVEFWKHRCPKTTKFEKIETLKSVLGLLKMDPEAKKVEWKPKEEASSSILSRLYLADASVFPRKDDIKPISAVEASSTHVSTSSDDNKADKTGKTDNLNSDPLKNNASYLDSKKNKSTSSGSKTGTISSKGSQTGISNKSSGCLSADSAIDTQKGKIGEPDDIKTDKRKWALQILARKTSSNSTSPGQQNQEKDATLKGNYPLLAQLPVDMRPNLESCRHNKIPNSVRQAQLYRLAEYLLRLTNISPIRKTAATELAVADAINIERELANRSKSKVVYLNLCSQELKRHKSTDSENPVEDSNPSTLLAVSTEEQPFSSSPSLDPEVEKALRNAGLLPDSPPSGTFHGAENFNDDDEGKDKVPDNVLELESNPELDIYGEFEYDIEDEDYIGASTVKESMQTEEGESKMKVVFSTLVADKQETAPNSETLERLTGELVSSSASQSDCKTDANDESFIRVGQEESPSLPPDSTTEGVEEPTPTECEELYGPDKEPLFASFPLNSHALALGVKPSEVESGKQDPGKSDAHPKENEDNPQVNVGKQQQETDYAVTRKVQAYIKEHIRPLCKSGVISVEQYRWAVAKTTDKVMKFHSKAKNANFLIKEGEKVKKLAEQYVEAANVKDKDK